jgi:fatty acid synthase
MIERDIENGIVKPLKTTVFQASEIEQAFRYLGSGKHIGKVLIQVRETETDKFTVPIPECHPRIYCDRNSSYVSVDFSSMLIEYWSTKQKQRLPQC